MKQGMFSRIAGMMFICLCAWNSNVSAAEQSDEVNTGQDFTKPLTRFDIRQKYQDLPGDSQAFMTTLRVDKPVVINADGWVLSLRADIPFVVNDVPSADNPGSQSRFGLSDILNQFMFIAPQGTKSWTYAIGSQIIWPTASEDQMGSGRYQFAPLVGAKINLAGISPGSFGYLLLRDHIDMGGDDSRAKVNYLVIQPGINFALPNKSFVTIAPEMRVDWENDNRVFIPFDIAIGKMVNKSTVLSIEYKTPVLDDDYPVYDHEVEARIGFFF